MDNLRRKVMNKVQIPKKNIDYTQFSTFQREYDEVGEKWGVHFYDGDEILETLWFDNELQAEGIIDDWFKDNSRWIDPNA